MLAHSVCVRKALSPFPALPKIQDIERTRTKYIEMKAA